MRKICSTQIPPPSSSLYWLCAKLCVVRCVINPFLNDRRPGLQAITDFTLLASLVYLVRLSVVIAHHVLLSPSVCIRFP